MDTNSLKHNNDHAPYTQDSWASMPKRKPIPSAIAPAGAQPAIPLAEAQQARPSAHGQKRTLPLGFAGLKLKWQRRSRNLLIIGIVVAVLLIALIIGLAVGLTVGKR